MQKAIQLDELNRNTSVQPSPSSVQPAPAAPTDPQPVPVSVSPPARPVSQAFAVSFTVPITEPGVPGVRSDAAPLLPAGVPTFIVPIAGPDHNPTVGDNLDQDSEFDCGYQPGLSDDEEIFRG